MCGVRRVGIFRYIRVLYPAHCFSRHSHDLCTGASLGSKEGRVCVVAWVPSPRRLPAASLLWRGSRWAPPKKRVSPRAVSAAVGPSRPLEGGGQGALFFFRAVGCVARPEASSRVLRRGRPRCGLGGGRCRTESAAGDVARRVIALVECGERRLLLYLGGWHACQLDMLPFPY